jgi:hypothetical protein
MRVSHGGGQQLLLWRHRAGSHADMLADRHDGQLQGRSVSKLLAGRIDIAVAYGTSCNRWMPMPELAIPGGGPASAALADWRFLSWFFAQGHVDRAD